MKNDTLQLSAFIICYNEESRIEGCIRSLHQCREIVVVDSGSTDKTIERIEALKLSGFPILLLHNVWAGYSAQKQYALDQCSQKWCLNIDADERLDAALTDALPKLCQATDEIVGWRIARRPYILGYGYASKRVHERRNLRLICRGHGQYDLTQKVHEGIIPDGRIADSKTGALLHFTPTYIHDQILKENTYSHLKAQMIIDGDHKRSPWRMIVTPPLYFVRLYFWNGLWRTGFTGFIQAVTGSIYSFTTEAKVYQQRAAKKKPAVDEII